MKEYDLFVPLRYNDGSPIEGAKFRHLQSELLERFGGVTYFPQASEGLWKLGELTYRDEIPIYRVLTNDVRGATTFFRDLKERLKADLNQEEILIVERDVKTL